MRIILNKILYITLARLEPSISVSTVEWSTTVPVRMANLGILTFAVNISVVITCVGEMAGQV
jgi:hypothetical protein